MNLYEIALTIQYNRARRTENTVPHTSCQIACYLEYESEIKYELYISDIHMASVWGMCMCRGDDHIISASSAASFLFNWPPESQKK